VSRLQDGAPYDIKSKERTRYVPTQQGDLEMKNIFATLFSAIFLSSFSTYPALAQSGDAVFHTQVCVMIDDTFTDGAVIEMTDNGVPVFIAHSRVSEFRLCVERVVGSEHKLSFSVDGRKIGSGTIVVQNRTHWVTVSKNRSPASDEVTISFSFQEPKSVLPNK